jgi:hypothetical protein
MGTGTSGGNGMCSGFTLMNGGVPGLRKMIAEHGFEQARPRLDFLDRVEIMKQGPEMLDPRDQLIVGTRGQGGARGVIKRRPDHAHHSSHDQRKKNSYPDDQRSRTPHGAQGLSPDGPNE